MAISTAAALIGSAVVGGVVARKGAKDAAKAAERANESAIGTQERTADAQITEIREAREEATERTQPFVDLGTAAGEQLGEFIQTPGGEFVPANELAPPAPEIQFSDPSTLLSEINPIVSFLRQQGFEQIQETAAAGGRLGAGGTLRDLAAFDANLNATLVPGLQQQRFNQELSQNTLAQQAQNQKFNQGLASNQQGLNQNQQGFNQLFNTTALGANAATGQASTISNAASNIANVQGVTGANVGDLQTSTGATNAAGTVNATNAVTGTLSNLAGIAGAFPSLFGGATPPPPSFGVGTSNTLPSGSLAAGAFPGLFGPGAPTSVFGG